MKTVSKDPVLSLVRTLENGRSCTERCDALRRLLALPPEERGSCRRYLLESFADWAEESMDDYGTNAARRCLEFLRELLKAPLAPPPEEGLMEPPEPLFQVLTAMERVFSLATPLWDSDLEDAWVLSVDEVLLCPQCGGPLSDLMALALVVRILHELRDHWDPVSVPWEMDRLVRLYLLLSLPSPLPTELAVVWVMGGEA